MPRDAFVLKIQRELCHPKFVRKVPGLSRNGRQVFDHEIFLATIGYQIPHTETYNEEHLFTVYPDLDKTTAGNSKF